MVKKSPAKKKAKTSKGEPRSDVTPCSSSQEDPTLLLGELVEVRHREIGYRGSWHPAKVVQIDSDKGLVEYEKLRCKDGEVKYQEYVPFSEDGSKVLLRPRPPPLRTDETWQKGLWVDAFHGDAWWEGVLMDEVSDQMQVYFPDEGDRMSFCMSNLRVSQDWDNRTRTWKIKGKMTELSSIEGRKFRLKRTFAVQPKRITMSQVTEKGSEDVSKRKRGEMVETPEANSDDESLYSWLLKQRKKQKVDIVQKEPATAVLSGELDPVQTHQTSISRSAELNPSHSEQTPGVVPSSSIVVATQPSVAVSQPDIVQQTSSPPPRSPEKVTEPEAADTEMADGIVEDMEVQSADVPPEQTEVASEVILSEMADGPGEKMEASVVDVVKETLGVERELLTPEACPVEDVNEGVLPTDSVAKKAKILKKLVGRNSFCKDSPSKTAVFTRAKSTARRILSDSGWKVCQSVRERFNRNGPEPFYVSPEGKPYVTMAAACRELIRRNKHMKAVSDRKKLSHLQLIAKGDDYRCPSELLAQSSAETSQRARLDDKTRKQKVEKKRGRPRSGCRLEVATPARKKNEDDEELKIIQRMALFSWLIEMGTISEHDKAQYLNSETGVMFTGVVTQEGILCNCCKVTYSLAGFQVHAGCSAPSIASQLRFQSGRSLLDCQLAALTAMKAKEEEAVAAAEVIELDINDDTCGMCGDGGDLICCDHCPSTFHLKCIQLKNVPEGDWFCPRCCCAICSSSLYNPENQADILYCDQCEREYHARCINGEGLKYKSGDNRFCSRKCLKIFRGLRKLVGRTNSVDEGYTWTLLRSDLHNHLAERNLNIEAIAENSSRLALALTVIQECFRPMIDPRTKTDIVTHIIYNRRGDDKRLDFRGFYTLLLERGDELVSVASIRIHGAHAAELPFVATRAQYRRQGMCRRLMNIVEQVLQALEVQSLVLPAIPEFVDTWTAAFGFQKLSAAQGVQLMELNIITFPGTSVLHKALTWLQCGKRPPPSEERIRLSLWESDQSDDEQLQLQRSENRTARKKALPEPETQKKSQKLRLGKKGTEHLLVPGEGQNQELSGRRVVVANGSSRMVKSFAGRLVQTSTDAIVEQTSPRRHQSNKELAVFEDEADDPLNLRSPRRAFVRRRLEPSTAAQENLVTKDLGYKDATKTAVKEKQKKKVKKFANKDEVSRHKTEAREESRRQHKTDNSTQGLMPMEVAECKKRLSSRIATAELGAFLLTNWPKSKRSVTVKRPRIVVKQPVLPRRSPRTLK